MKENDAKKLTGQIIEIISRTAPVMPLEAFLDSIGVRDYADEEYIEEILRKGRLLSADEFEDNPYIKNIHIKTSSRGSYTLAENHFEKGELLSYMMPERTPALGSFDRKVSFPGIYEESMPWMSVCPTEIETMRNPIAKAKGRMLVLGLGLGYYPYMISRKSDVTKITVVECSREIIGLFEEQILPQFEEKEKIQIVLDDAMAYIKEVSPGDYDGVFCDIWESQVDGAFYYPQLKEQEKRLEGTIFQYWIEKEIKEYLEVEGL